MVRNPCKIKLIDQFERVKYERSVWILHIIGCGEYVFDMADEKDTESEIIGMVGE